MKTSAQWSLGAQFPVTLLAASGISSVACGDSVALVWSSASDTVPPAPAEPDTVTTLSIESVGVNDALLPLFALWDYEPQELPNFTIDMLGLELEVSFTSARPRWHEAAPFDEGPQPPTGLVLRGSILAPHSGYVVVVVDPDGFSLSARVDGESSYRVSAAGDGYVAYEVGSDATGACAVAEPGLALSEESASEAPASLLDGGGSCDDGSVIDVIVLYTTAAKTAANGHIESVIEFAVADANQAYENSWTFGGTPPQLRLVYSAERTGYVEPGTMAQIRAAMQDPWDGVLDEIHPLRDTLRADLVCLIVKANFDTQILGLATSMQQLSPDQESQAFCVVKWDVARDPFWVFAHEIGHLLGCGHEPDNQDECTLECADESGVFTYSRGYVFQPEGRSCQHTIMHSSPPLAIDHFSNPDVLWPLNDPTDPTGVEDCFNNALTIANTRETVSAYRRFDDSSDTMRTASYDEDEPALGNAASRFPAISASGKWVVFESDAENFSAFDEEEVTQLFRFNRESGVVRPVTARTEEFGDGPSSRPAISGDGHYVAFTSSAENLTQSPTSGEQHILVCDFMSSNFQVASTNSAGHEGNGASDNPRLSATGRFVAFQSDATNLVAGTTNEWTHIYWKDRTTGSIVRVSKTSAGVQAENGGSIEPTISGSGARVAFTSAATNLIGSSDTNGLADIFLHDTTTLVTTRVSVAFSSSQQPDGASGAPSISADGNLIAFHSGATNLVDSSILDDTNRLQDVFVYNITTGVTTLISANPSTDESGDGASSHPSISANGRYVAFESEATDLLPSGSTSGRQVFLHDLETGDTILASLNSDQEEADGDSFGAAVSDDGRFIAMASDAENLLLVTDDDNEVRDVIVRDRGRQLIYDLNGDDIVGTIDEAILLQNWGYDCTIADVDGDGDVDATDLAILLGEWTE